MAKRTTDRLITDKALERLTLAEFIFRRDWALNVGENPIHFDVYSLDASRAEPVTRRRAAA